MELPYQKQARLAQTAANIIEAYPVITISNESCENHLKTLVDCPVKEDDNSSRCIRNELIEALACLDQLEKEVTGVSTKSSTIKAYDQGKEEGVIVSERQDTTKCLTD